MEYEYQVGGRTVRLQADPHHVAVRYREPAPHSQRAAFAKKAGASFEARVEVPNEKYTVLPLNDAKALAPGPQAAAAAAGSGVARLAPVFRLGSTQVLATERVLVGLDDPSEPVDPVLAGLRVVDVRSAGYGEYTVQLAEDEDPLAVAKDLAGRPGVAYAEPDFVNIGRHLARSPLPADAAPLAPGQLLGQQYAMTTIGAPAAWAIQGGRPDVRIAILDEGVDTGHQDLAASIVGCYDAADRDEYQEPNPWDGHGTACAGLAAAVPNNGMGVRGVAGGCSILAVRIAYSDAPGGSWAWSSEEAALAIDWAWGKGADVLSNSWGGGAPSTRIVRAFERARTLGRQGKGCVVVIAAGNEAGPVSFPAYLPRMVAVSACNHVDEFKTPTSSDGEPWGSNFGPEVMICAPGVRNLTTDISGGGGYNKKGNYYSSFNGTSSATPLVAGTAALMISANPSLTEQEVREMLCETAHKVPGIDFGPSGRNHEWGFGRLDAAAAVRAAAAAAQA